MSEAKGELELLRQQHSFPCALTYKVIGERGAALVEGAHAAILRVTGEAPPAPLVRVSAQGAHQGLTFRAHTHGAEQALEVFAALRALPGVRFVL